MRPSHGASLSVRGALAVVFVNRYAVLAINIVSLVIVARLVTPAETGLFSIAASVVMLAQSIRDFGIAEFLVQEKDLTQAKIRTAFGLNLLLAWSLGAIIFLTRNWMAELYETPELANLIAVVCGSFLVAPFSSTVQALLNRRMDFVAMMKISIASNFANAAVSIPLAYFGWGAMALSLGMLAMNVTTAVVTGLFTRSWDHFVPSLREWRRLASFGLYMSGTNTLNQIGARIPELVIGRLIGLEPLGLFTRARGTVSLFYDLIVSSVHTVAFPSFSMAHRAGEDVQVPYLRATTLITGAVLPVMAVLAITAEPLVRLMLGTQWLAVADLVPGLVLANAITALAPIVPPVLSATGGIRWVLRAALWQQGIQLILIGIFANYGLNWVVVSQVIGGAACLMVNAHYLRQGIGLKTTDLLLASLPSLWVALLSAALPLAYRVCFRSNDDPALMTLTITAVLAVPSWIAATRLVRHPVGQELDLILRYAMQAMRRPA